jgi:hypothetical protein
MQLSQHLSLSAMTNSSTAKRLGIKNFPTAEHLDNLKHWAVNIFEPVRKFVGFGYNPSSGYRSAALNKATPGASKTSQHSKGEAGDLDFDNTTVTNAEVFHFIKDNLEFDQLIWEYGTNKNPAWVHVSLKRNGPQRKQILKAIKNSKGKTVYVPYT